MCGNIIDNPRRMGSIAKRGFALAIFLLIVGGLNWGWQAATGKDFVTRFVGQKYAWIVFAAVGIAALYIAFARDTYLPFLGPTVMPCSLLKEQTPEGADTEIHVQVQPGAKVIFWAAEPANEELHKLNSWKEAYLTYKNAGVTTADNSGNAVLRIRSPQPYLVPVKGRLEAHVHYRVCINDGGLGRVETKMVRATEAFISESPRMMEATNEEETEQRMGDMQENEAKPEEYEDYDESDAENFENYSAQFESDVSVPNRTTNNILNEIAEHTEKFRLTDKNGVEEGPKAEGAELDIAFNTITVQ